MHAVTAVAGGVYIGCIYRKYICSSITFVVIPTLTHYSGIVSDTPSGRIYGILSGHPELAIWCSGPGVPHSIRSWPCGSEHSKTEGGGGDEDEED